MADGLALCSPREGACAERAVKKTLRCATRSSLITHNQQRLAVASAIYGVTAQRATLAHLCARAGLEGEACGSAAARRRLADARLLALFLLHGSPHRISRPQILAVLDPSMIVCTHDLARIKALDPATVRWPTRRIPRLALQYSLPTALVRLWASVLPLQEVETLAAACSLPGVVTLRANTMRCSRDELASQLREDGLIVSEGSLSPTALRLQGGREAWGGSVWSLRQWSAGWFELQDEGSQFIAHATRATHGEHVLDMCAGNGGKSLALAAMVGARGRVTAHDVVHTRLRALQASSVRAGVSSQVDALHTYTRLTIVCHTTHLHEQTYFTFVRLPCCHPVLITRQSGTFIFHHYCVIAMLLCSHLYSALSIGHSPLQSTLLAAHSRTLASHSIVISRT